MLRLALPALLLLAGCARSEEANFVSVDNAARAVESVNSSEGDDQEIALGAWRPSVLGDQPTLEFGPSGAPALFSLACDPRHGLLLQRHGAAPSGDLPAMLVTIGSETRRLALTSTTGPLPMLRSTLQPSDPFLAILTGATVPIIIRIGDTPPLVLPPSPMIADYVSRCSSGAAAGPEEESNGITEINSTAPAAR
jgi:hypothetical protein